VIFLLTSNRAKRWAIIGVNGARQEHPVEDDYALNAAHYRQWLLSEANVVALLELGMGFFQWPTLTGRQKNVFMAGNCWVLGMDELHALMPAIEPLP